MLCARKVSYVGDPCGVDHAAEGPKPRGGAPPAQGVEDDPFTEPNYQAPFTRLDKLDLDELNRQDPDEVAAFNLMVKNRLEVDRLLLCGHDGGCNKCDSTGTAAGRTCGLCGGSGDVLEMAIHRADAAEIHMRYVMSSTARVERWGNRNRCTAVADNLIDIAADNWANRDHPTHAIVVAISTGAQTGPLRSETITNWNLNRAVDPN